MCRQDLVKKRTFVYNEGTVKIIESLAFDGIGEQPPVAISVSALAVARDEGSKDCEDKDGHRTGRQPSWFWIYIHVNICLSPPFFRPAPGRLMTQRATWRKEGRISLSILWECYVDGSQGEKKFTFWRNLQSPTNTCQHDGKATYYAVPQNSVLASYQWLRGEMNIEEEVWWMRQERSEINVEEEGDWERENLFTL